MNVTVDKKEDIVMRLVHYFITEQNYQPIVVNGVKNEIWLENLDGPYRIIRINSNYIHNKEQITYDIYKTKNIIKQIKRKTLSLKVNTLNIFLDLNKDVKFMDIKDMDMIKINNIGDIKRNKVIKNSFPDISNNLLNDTKGIDLIINVTNDINEKTAKENSKYEKTFSKKKIVITNILIAINILIFILSLGIPYMDYIFASNRSLFASGEYYRAFSAMFMHANIIHLTFNMYALYVIGNQVETFLGKKKYIIIYLLSGVLGNLLSMGLQNTYSVGASGAIFGLMGALLYFGYHYRLYLNSVMTTQIIPLLLFNLALGFVIPGIDIWAHLGGLIGGYLSAMAVGIDGKTIKKDTINGIIVYTLMCAFLIWFILFN